MDKRESPFSAAVNITKRWAALKDATSPKPILEPTLVEGCRTQIAFANLYIPHLEIYPLALNTLKAAADEAILPGGWKEIDELRKLVLDKTTTQSSQKVKPRRNAQSQRTHNIEKISELSNKLDSAHRFRGIMLRAYQSMLDNLRELSKDDSEAYEKLLQHESTFDIRVLYPVEQDNPENAHSGQKKKVNSQLYTVIPNVEIPSFSEIDATTGDYSISPPRILDAMVFMSWPNGSPCLEVELYLNALCDVLRADRTGGSIKEVAAKLSHLVRFCWTYRQRIGQRVNFWELNNVSYSAFLSRLRDESHKTKLGAAAREHNRVREVSDTCLAFLVWLQSNVLVGRNLVGLKATGSQIGLILKSYITNTGNVRTRHAFPFEPENSTRDPKQPIATELIQQLWQAAHDKSDPTKVSSAYRKKFRSESDFLNYLEYLRKRRECMLTLLQTTGLRPAELVETKFSENLKPTTKKVFCLPTKKREPGAKRQVPTVLNAAMKVEVFGHIYRSELLSRLTRMGRHPNPQDFLLLDDEGNPMTKAALTKDFQRLCEYAGINQRACLSMFRHRFITLMVAIHLREFMEKNPGMKLSDSDYRTVLTKVTSFTGHKNPDSLMPYINLAWEELGAFDEIEAAREIAFTLETLLPMLRSHAVEFRRAPKSEAGKVFDEAISWLDSLCLTLSEALSRYKTKKAISPVTATLTI